MIRSSPGTPRRRLVVLAPPPLAGWPLGWLRSMNPVRPFWRQCLSLASTDQELQETASVCPQFMAVVRGWEVKWDILRIDYVDGRHDEIQPCVDDEPDMKRPLDTEIVPRSNTPCHDAPTDY